MGNRASRASCFFTVSRRSEDDLQTFSSGFDEGLGHSFCYIKPPPTASPSASPAPSKSRGGEFPTECSRITSSRDGVLPKASSDASFNTISGASVSANTSTPLSLSSWEQFNSFSGIPSDCNAAFESSASFCALPLQPLPPKGMAPYSGSPSGPLDKGLSSSPHDRVLFFNSLERGFASGPLERGHLSGPMEFADRTHFSAPITAFYHRRPSVAKMFKKVSRPVKNVIGKTVPKTSSGTLTRMQKSSSFDNEKKEGKVSRGALDKAKVQWAQGKAGEDRVHIVLSESHGWLFVGIYDGFNGPDATDFLLSNLYPAIQDELQGLLWNQKGEYETPITNAVILDRSSGSEPSCQAVADIGIMAKNGVSGDTHGSGKSRVVLSNMKDNGSNVAEPFGERPRRRVLESPKVDRQAGKENLEQHRKDDGASVSARGSPATPRLNAKAQVFQCAPATDHVDNRGRESRKSNDGLRANCISSVDKVIRKIRSDMHEIMCKDDKCRTQLSSLLNLEREQVIAEETRKPREAEKQSDNINDVDHAAVLDALARALEATESAFLEMADQVILDNPELALMGSCVLVMLMKGEDVYVMNVGDSRAVLALKPMDPSVTEKPLNRRTLDRTQSDFQKNAGRDSESQAELERINEEARTDFESLRALEHVMESSTLAALQLSSDHSTCVIEEVRRIQSEHPDDEKSVSKDRVKGNLKVTRAFGAGFLKHPKWNNALLEMFQINYVGSSPYLSCKPALYHHRLAPEDHFLVLSSDGLYQYLTNEEVVAHVEWFMKRNPDGDPAQYLVEELLFRAAKKAGMDFLQLLNIPQGDRRRYHDDVSVMVVSLEGKTWRSSS